MDLLNASYQFLEHLKVVKNSSPHTVRNYAIDLDDFFSFVWNRINTSEEEIPTPRIHHIEKTLDCPIKILIKEHLHRREVRMWIAHLHERGVTKKTIVRKIASMRSFCRYLLSKQHLEENPMEEIQSPKVEKKIPQSLELKQVENLLSQPDTTNYLGLRDRVILEILYSSGLRVSELVALNKSDIDWQESLIKLRGKGKKERIVPLTPHALEWLRAYVNHPERHVDIDGHQAEVDKEAIFLNRLGTRLTARSVDRGFSRYFKLSGIAGKATPHDIRHTIATEWLNLGMDLKTIQKILGHTSLSTTTIYTKVTSQHKKEVYETTHPTAKEEL